MECVRLMGPRERLEHVLPAVVSAEMSRHFSKSARASASLPSLMRTSARACQASCRLLHSGASTASAFVSDCSAAARVALLLVGDAQAVVADAKAGLGDGVLQRFDPWVDLPGQNLRPAEVAPGEEARLERRVLGERREDRDGLRISLLEDEDLSERVLGLAEMSVLRSGRAGRTSRRRRGGSRGRVGQACRSRRRGESRKRSRGPWRSGRPARLPCGSGRGPAAAGPCRSNPARRRTRASLCRSGSTPGVLAPLPPHAETRRRAREDRRTRLQG